MSPIALEPPSGSRRSRASFPYSLSPGIFSETGAEGLPAFEFARRRPAGSACRIGRILSAFVSPVHTGERGATRFPISRNRAPSTFSALRTLPDVRCTNQIANRSPTRAIDTFGLRASQRQLVFFASSAVPHTVVLGARGCRESLRRPGSAHRRKGCHRRD